MTVSPRSIGQETAVQAAPRALVAQLPNGPGVYRFSDASDHLLYIGRAVNLRRRVGSYWTHPAGHLAEMVNRVARIEAVSCSSEHEAVWLERNLLGQRLPPWNKTAGGQEVPVFLRLDWHSSSPGIEVVHSVERSPQSHFFGPYLGGGKVRLAASALRRVMPLAYAGEVLRGSEQDMARVRGVDPSTRLALVDAMRSALERDPAAVGSVRAQLVNRRDSAAQSLDFERAAQVQAELEGFDWVVSEQNVALAEPLDFGVCGWSHGVLVHFAFRGGRLSAWTQHTCTETAAQRCLLATPSAWLEFGERNADLAARLTVPSATGHVKVEHGVHHN
jgi:excinuclease ABC subunit C